MNNPQNIQPIASAVLPATPMEMLSRALVNGATPETLEKLLALQERWEQNQLRKTFDAAIAAARAKIPPIKKNRTVSFGSGKTAYHHEDLAEIERTVMPILSEHGVGYRFRTTVSGKDIIVTCVLFKDGYREENSLPGLADTSGSKNPIQALGSTLTYLQRYSLRAALGLSASDDDDAVSVGAKAPKAAPNVMHDPQTGEITETAAPTPAASREAADAAPLPDGPSDTGSGAAQLDVLDMAREAADRGQEQMRKFWRKRTKAEQAQIETIRPELNKIVDEAQVRILQEKADEEEGRMKEDAAHGIR